MAWYVWTHLDTWTCHINYIKLLGWSETGDRRQTELFDVPAARWCADNPQLWASYWWHVLYHAMVVCVVHACVCDQIIHSRASVLDRIDLAPWWWQRRYSSGSFEALLHVYVRNYTRHRYFFNVSLLGLSLIEWWLIVSQIVKPRLSHYYFEGIIFWLSVYNVSVDDKKQRSEMYLSKEFT